MNNAQNNNVMNIYMILPSGKTLSIARDNYKLSVHVHGTDTFTHISDDAFSVANAIQKAIQDDVRDNMSKN